MTLNDKEARFAMVVPLKARRKGNVLMRLCPTRKRGC